MKKIILILILSAVANGVNAQIVNIPDVNFKHYLVSNSAINTNGDSEIQVSEAIAFTGTIHCDSFSISDLTGIEVFVNLTKLWCYNNQLTNLDLSQNTALVDLQCDSNQLTNLDLTNNVALKILSCHINKLTTLNVNKNIALKILYCYENQLTDINVSKNLALEKFYCSLNKLTNLDLSNNIALKSLVCNWNQLSSLNIKNGNNAALQTMNAKGNPNLCIQVDNTSNANSYPNWAKDATANYSVNCNYMAVSEMAKNEIKIYPNPVIDKLNFSEEVSEIKIRDIFGKVVKQFSSSKSINILELSKGIYILTAKTRAGRNINHKIIKDL